MLYQLSYLGTEHGKTSRALLQDRLRKIKLSGCPFSARALLRWAVAEREGFEPSVRVLPLRRFSKPLPSATRPPLHSSQLFAEFPIIDDVIDDRRTTSTRAVILPQALWEVQVIREMDPEKLSTRMATVYMSTCLVH